MARKAGARNHDHETRRRELLDRMRARLGEVGATRASWRELAAAAGVGLATLNHYFGKREAVVRAILEANGEAGRAPLAVLATPLGPFATSVRHALDHLALGLQRFGVGEMLALGLIEGLRQPGLGPAFVDASLEPVIQAAAARLRAHQEAGEMRAADPRVAALALVAPVILADLHQVQLGGSADHPLAMSDLLDQHTEAFVRAYVVEDVRHL